MKAWPVFFGIGIIGLLGYFFIAVIGIGYIAGFGPEDYSYERKIESGQMLLVFCTPILLVPSLIFFYFGLKKIFEKNVALISALLLYFHPIFIYYTAKSLMPNILFVNFLIISLSLVLCASIKKGVVKYFRLQPIIFYFFSGLFLGLALSIRPSEIFWIFFI